MTSATIVSVRNGQAVKLDEVPELSLEEFRETVIWVTREGGRLVALFGRPGKDGAVNLWAALATEPGMLSFLSTEVGSSYPALTPDCPQAHLFEREVFEQCGARPEGHPWLKPVRSQAPAEFFRVEGEEVHEVAVGPVHAGIIEPGHFRFQCHGEQVLHLEISLGYQHRGVERALRGGPGKRSIHYMETLAGDTTIGHAIAYCEALEALAGCVAPRRAEALRGIALELERLANHAGDLGALANDVGYLPTASYCGRIRGDFLNLTALACGSRFGRGWVRPGGAAFDLDGPRPKEALERLEKALRDARGAVNLLWETSSVRARFENTATLSPETCRDLGMVGVAARASGVERDVRREFPSGIYRSSPIPISTARSGDVFARAQVRWLEMERSARFVMDAIRALPGGPIRVEVGELAPESLVAALVEGWRGEICHLAMTDREGCFSAYKVVDPSFHNWMGLAMALRGQQISDFPLSNKSFNLSYCGHDL